MAHEPDGGLSVHGSQSAQHAEQCQSCDGRRNRRDRQPMWVALSGSAERTAAAQRHARHESADDQRKLVIDVTVHGLEAN